MNDQIRYVDRETTAFVRDGYAVHVWCDFLPGFWSRGRVIHTDTVQDWLGPNGEVVRPVTSTEKTEIIRALTEYHRRGWRKVEIAP